MNTNNQKKSSSVSLKKKILMIVLTPIVTSGLVILYNQIQSNESKKNQKYFNEGFTLKCKQSFRHDFKVEVSKEKAWEIKDQYHFKKDDILIQSRLCQATPKY